MNDEKRNATTSMDDEKSNATTSMDDEKSNAHIVQGRLKNNMQYACIQTGCSSTVIFGVFVNVGARHETDQTHGIAHLIEHLLFRGTPTRPSKQVLLRPIIKYGGDINAMTCHEYTMFHVKMPASKIHVGTDVYLDMFQSARVNQKDVNVETKTVIQEKRQTQSSPSVLFMHKVHTILFKGTSLGHNVSGNVSHLTALTLPCIYAFLDTFYVPNNIRLVAAGHIVDVNDFITWLETTWGQWKRQPYGASLTTRSDIDEYQTWKKKWSRETSLISQWPSSSVESSAVTLIRHKLSSHDAMISLAFPTRGKSSKDEMVTDVLGSYLAGNMTSPLFQKLREEKGWVYSISYTDMMYYDAGFSQFVCRTKSDVNTILSIVTTILQDIRDIAEHGLSNETFLEARDFVTMRIQSDQDDVFSWVTMAGEQLLHRDKTDELYVSWLKRIRNVTQSDVQNAAKHLLSPQRMRLTVWIPSDQTDALMTRFKDRLHMNVDLQDV
jgi:predicted Zn-dependent peptidase